MLVNICHKKLVILKVTLIITSMIATLLLLVACKSGESDKPMIDTSEPVYKGGTTSAQKQLEEIAKQQEENKDLLLTDDFEWPEESLVVCLEGTNQIGIVDLEKEELVGKISVGSSPRNIARSRDNKRIFVSNAMSGDVTVVKIDSGEDFTIPMGSSPLKMVVSPDDRYLYVVDYYMNGVRVVDTELLSLVKVLGMNNTGFGGREMVMDCCVDPFANVVDFGRGPTTLAIDAEGKNLYLGNLGTYDFSVIDIEEGWEQVTWDGIVGVRDVSIAGLPAKLYVAAIGSGLIYSDELAIFDIETGQLEKKIQIGHEPIALALNPNGEAIYVLAREGRALAEIELASNELVRTVEIADDARAMTISDDGKFIYISHERAGTISIVETENLEVVSSINVGVKPYASVYLLQEP